jgi:cysteine desulfurase
MTRIYLDHNATTPVDPGVLQAMLPYLRDDFGNPSSAHTLGVRARDAVETARANVAALIGATPDEIIFTSGGTEASNIAIRGAVRIDGSRGDLVTTTIEHPATEACCAFLEGEKHKVTRVEAQPNGLVDPMHVDAAIDGKTSLVTIIHAQNEIGTIQPVAEIAATARRRGTFTHADAAQSVGKIPVDVKKLGVDFLSIAGHKLYAPKGVGALYVRRGVELPPLLLGAGQERGRRPGPKTLPSSWRSAKLVVLRARCSKANNGGSLILPTSYLRDWSARFRVSSWLAADRKGCRTQSIHSFPMCPADSCWKIACE